MKTQMILALVAVFALTATVQAVTLYSENFDGVGNGNPITSAAGWSMVYGSSSVVVNNATPLGSGTDLAVDGTTGDYSFYNHAALAPTVGATTWTLEADVYVTDHYSHDSGLGFGTGTNAMISLEYAWVSASDRGWKIFAGAGWTGIIGYNQNIGSQTIGVDEVAHAKLVFDLVANTVVGTVTAASGTVTSPTISFVDGNESLLVDIIYWVDHRSDWVRGMDLDNVVLSDDYIPEPASMVLLALGGGLMALRRRH